MPRVQLVEYQAGWRQAFERIAAELKAIMASPVVRVEHIGSTAVPGLCAKPVIDVLLGSDHLALFDAKAPSLAAQGYRYRPEYEAQIPDRRYFVKDADGGVPRVHLHAVLIGGTLWRDHLGFRDALRRDRELAVAYGRLKLDLAESRGLDKGDYTEAKAPFIRQILAGHLPAQDRGDA